MNEYVSDQTGYGYSSGGFAPTPDDSAAARRNKHEMDRMSMAMQKLDPVLQRTIDTLIRTQIRNGASPEEARRAAFGSAQGQMMSDSLLGLRRTGFLGQGDPINYGRNVLQGVSGGGFSLGVIDAAGGARSSSQSVMGGGLLAGQASVQMAKDLMTNLYGEGSTDPRRLYGANMEDASSVFRKLAERGALGNIGTLKHFGEKEAKSATAVNDKLENARRQEVDPLIKAALEGTNAENIQSKIQEALKNGDKQIATALEDIQSSRSMLVMDDKNTKRVADITKETIKGLANLKDVYGELNSDQLLAKMEALTGISVSNKAEARKAAQMTQRITNTAMATGNDPRGVAEMMIMQQGDLQARLAGQFGQEMGQGGAAGGLGKELAGAVNNAINDYAMTAEASARGNAADIEKQFGVSITDVSREDIIADTKAQMLTWTGQNKNIMMMSGQAESTLKNDKEFQKKSRSILDRMARAKDENERRVLENEAADLNMQYNNGKDAEAMLETDAGKAMFKNANMRKMAKLSGANSAMAVRNDRSDQIIKDVIKSGGVGADKFDSISEAFKRMGVSGMAKLAGADGKLKSAAERQAELDIMVKNKTLSQEEADAMGAYTSSATDAQYAGNIESVGASTARGQSYHDIMIAQAEVDSRTNIQQRERFSDENGVLSLKSIANSILSGPDKGGLQTTTQQMYALAAMQKAGLAGDLKPTTEINWDDGLSKKEMDGLRASIGDKNFSMHGRLNFDSEEAMLEATKGEGGADLRRDMMEMLQDDDRLMSGGTTDSMFYGAADQAEDVGKRAQRMETAMRFGKLQGVEITKDVSSWSDEMKEIMDTGKVSKGGIGIKLETDVEQAVYDDNGRGKGNILRTFSDKALDKAHFKQAGKLVGIADQVNDKSTTEAMIEQNNLSGGALLEGLEKQLESMKATQSKGAKIVDTTVDGKQTRLDMDESVQKLTSAIEKLKSDDGKNPPIKEMTVEVLKVKRQEPD